MGHEERANGCRLEAHILAELDAKNLLVVKSPKIGTGAPTDGFVLKIRTLISLKGDVAPA